MCWRVCVAEAADEFVGQRCLQVIHRLSPGLEKITPTHLHALLPLYIWIICCADWLVKMVVFTREWQWILTPLFEPRTDGAWDCLDSLNVVCIIECTETTLAKFEMIKVGSILNANMGIITDIHVFSEMFFGFGEKRVDFLQFNFRQFSLNYK